MGTGDQQEDDPESRSKCRTGRGVSRLLEEPCVGKPTLASSRDEASRTGVAATPSPGAEEPMRADDEPSRRDLPPSEAETSRLPTS